MKRVLYLLTISLIAVVSSCTKEDVKYMTAAEPLFEMSASEVYRDEAVSFTDKSTPLTGTEIVAWSWNFGENEESVSTEQNPTYTYGSIGDFTIMLVVTDSQGMSARALQTITVKTPEDELAHADFELSAEVFDINVPVEFKDTSIAATGATITSWAWTFGQDKDAVSSEQNPTYVYTQSGNYSVSLTVVDSQNNKSSISKDIQVLDPSDKIVTLWRSELWGNIQNTVSPAMSPDGTVAYAWSDGYPSGEDNVVLKAYDVATGSINWTFQVSDAYESVHPGSNVRLIYSSPSVGANGDIYIAGRDLGDDRRTYMLAVNADGTLKWSYDFGAGVNINFITPAIDADGYIYIGHLSVEPYQIAKIDPQTGIGTILASTEVGARAGISVDRSGNVYFCSTGSNGLFKYSQEGVLQWSYNTSFSTTGGAITIDKSGVTYTVATVADGSGVASAINPDGSTKWEYKTPAEMSYGGLVLGENDVVYFNGGGAKIGTESAGIYAVNQQTGELVWHFATEEDVKNCVPLVDNRGYVHFITDKGTYYVVNSDGELYGEKSLETQCYSSPVMSPDGKVVISVQNDNGASYVYCLDSGATAPANSDWPMKGQNHRRTQLQAE